MWVEGSVDDLGVSVKLEGFLIEWNVGVEMGLLKFRVEECDG